MAQRVKVFAARLDNFSLMTEPTVESELAVSQQVVLGFPCVVVASTGRVHIHAHKINFSKRKKKNLKNFLKTPFLSMKGRVCTQHTRGPRFSPPYCKTKLKSLSTKPIHFNYIIQNF